MVFFLVSLARDGGSNPPPAINPSIVQRINTRSSCLPSPTTTLKASSHLASFCWSVKFNPNTLLKCLTVIGGTECSSGGRAHYKSEVAGSNPAFPIPVNC